MLSGGVIVDEAGLAYGEQGRYALALEDGDAQPDLPELPIQFEDMTRAAGIAFHHSTRAELQSELGSGVLIHDLDGDLDDDVLLLGSNDGPSVRVFRNDGGGRFTEATAALGLDVLDGPAVGVAAGDFDDDGLVDLFVAGRLMRGTRGPGVQRANAGGAADQVRFVDATESAGFVADDLASTASLALVDLDHDGDLDLITTCPAKPAVRVHQNIGDGRFRPFVATGIDSDRPVVSLAFTDFDRDRDIDAVLGIDGQGVQLLANQRGFRFEDVTSGAGLPRSGPVRGIAVADVDGDAWPDLFVTNAGPDHHALLLNRRDGTFALAGRVPRAAPAAGALFADVDLDGDLDLLIGESAGLRFLRNDGRGALTEQTAQVGLDRVTSDVRGLAAGDLDGDGDLDLIANTLGGPAIVLRTSGAESRAWVKIVPSGFHSNESGYGTKLDVRAGRHRQQLEATGASGFLSQGPRSVLFGLGEQKRLDRLRLLWPGGVLQAETDLELRTTHVVEELNRKGESCPFLWAWNGHEIAFVSDIQAGSPLGLQIGPGLHNTPDPEEWFLLPNGAAVPTDGHYDLRITESLQEVCYLDRALLRVVDAPRGVLVFPNERLLLAPPFAEYGLHFVHTVVPPIRAVDAAGRDVRAELADIDRTYAGALVPRRTRGLAEPWSLELDFGRLTPTERQGGVVLLAHGWIEFTNSTPIYAAAQAGHHPQPPVLEVIDGAGQVVTTVTAAGAPAGLPKWMVLPIGDYLPDDGRVVVRYRSNLEVHFDQVMLGLTDPDTEHRVTDVEAATAELRRAGYPTRYLPGGTAPESYRYATHTGDETWHTQEGLYTRLGDVRPLVAAADDRLTVMVHGDELQLRFPVDRLPPLGEHQTRTLILHTIGYAKDLDPHSGAPATVGPLPYRSMPGYPYDGPGRFGDETYRAEVGRWNSRSARPTADALR